MKILHLYKTYYPDSLGGIQKVIDQLAVSTKAYGIENEVLTLTPNKYEETIEINGYKVHRVPQLLEIASCPFSFKIIRKFIQLAKTADIIHYHFPWPFADILHFFAKDKPYLVTYHSDIVKQKFLLKLYTPLMQRFLKNIDCIIAASPNYAATSKILKKFSNKTQIIPYGLNQADYPTPSQKLLNFWQNKFSPKFFLFIGVIRYYKGLQYLIEAAKNVGADILLVGSGNKIEKELILKAKNIGASNVYFLGELTDIDKVALLKLAYGFVFPSHLRSEAFGISLLEAAMFGKPLISCEIGTGTTFINIANETGIVVPSGNCLALQQAMQFLLSNPSLAKVMGENAKRRFQQLFTAEKMAEAYVQLYNSLIKKVS